VIVSYMNASLI